MRTALVYLLALGAVAAGAAFGFPELFGADTAADASDGGGRSTTIPPVIAPYIS